MSGQTQTLRVHWLWGTFAPGGAWYPNPLLKMPPEVQRQQNEATLQARRNAQADPMKPC